MTSNVAENSNFIQQREKLTSVYLFAPDITPAMNGEFPGLKMTDIPQSGKQIKQILDLIDQSNQPQQAPAPQLSEEPVAQGAQTG